METNTCLECGHSNPFEIHTCENCGAALANRPDPVGNPGSEVPPVEQPDGLPNATFPGEMHPPGSFLGKASLTPAQQAHTRLLQEMIASDGKTPPPPRQPERRSRGQLRIGVGLVIILTIIFSILWQQPVFSPPELPEETLAARQVISALPIGAPVLVAFDYQPGYSGEMSRAAQGVLAHLMAQQAYLVIVSTQPTGPALAELLLTDVGRKTGTAYRAPDQYQNLGYLPGGASGLLSLAQSPRKMTPLTIQGSLAWQASTINQISRVSDFSLALVITEDPDTGRMWIEQIGPMLEGKPLVSVISAQASPLLLPYYTSQPRQLQGLVSGVAGGMAYQNAAVFFLENEGAAIPWSVYSLAPWIGAMLMLIGVGMAFLRRMNEQYRDPTEQEKKP